MYVDRMAATSPPPVPRGSSPEEGANQRGPVQEGRGGGAAAGAGGRGMGAQAAAASNAAARAHAHALQAGGEVQVEAIAEVADPADLDGGDGGGSGRVW